MLIILSSIYCAVVWIVFIKLKLLPWNKGTKIGAVSVGIVGLLAVVIGFGMGAPVSSGGVMIQTDVMRIAAHSYGRVTKVHAEINQPMKKGDPIFEVDPSQYQAALDAANSTLRQAEYGMQQLKAAWEQAQANVTAIEAEQTVLESTIDAARANVDSSREAAAAARHALLAAQADVRKNEVDVEIGEVQHARVKQLVADKVNSQSDLDNATRTLEGFRAGLDRAQAMEKKGQDDVRMSGAQLRGAEASLKQAEATRQTLAAQLTMAKAAERQAYAAAEIDGAGEHSAIRSARAKVKDAQYDLDNCVVVAPSDGYVIALGLTEGNYVRMTQVGTFVSTERYWASAIFKQNTVQYIKPGMKAEFALRQYPGRILEGVVEGVTYGAGEAQMPVSGNLPAVNSMTMPRQFVVRFRLDGFPGDAPPHFSSAGSVAVYTDTATPVHVIRKIILRIESLMNWIP